MASSLFREPENKHQENNMLQQFLYFKNQMAGKDPKKMVEQLLNNGKMSREQFEQYSNMANQISQILK